MGEELKWFDPGNERIGILHCTEIKDKNRVRVSGSGRTWSTMIADTIIKSDELDTVSWKYTINKFETEMVIGWISNVNISETMQSIWSRANYIGERDIGFGIHILDNGKSGLFFVNSAGSKERPQIGTDETYKPFKAGDTFEIKIDFVQNICTILYNGFIVGAAFQDQIASEIIPAVSLRKKNSDVTISL